MKIRVKLRLALACSVTFATALAWLLVQTHRQMRDVTRRTEQTDAIVTSAFDLRILTGDLMAYGTERARLQWEAKYAALAHLLESATADTAEEGQLLARMQANANALERSFRRFSRELQSPPADASAAQFRAHQMARVDVYLLQLKADARRLFDLLYATMLRRERLNSAAIATFCMALLGLVVSVAAMVTRAAIRPLQHLETGAAAIGTGNLDHRLNIATQDEVGELARAFDRMADSLKATMASRDELAAEVANRRRAERQLQSAMAELARSNQELEQFAYVASHDLQEPLRKISAFGGLIREEAGPGLSPPVQDYLSRMENAVKRMQALIDDLLTLSRITTHAHPFAQVRLAEVLAEATSDLGAQLQETRGRIEAGELPTLQGDPVQLRQLLQNVIGNALKFHQPGVPPVVKISCTADSDSSWRITISDNGIGFDEKYLGKIFTIFQRLHSREVYSGSGIGLAVCKKIAERHGGSITARSQPGQGASFIISLPRLPSQAPDPATTE